MENTHIFHQAEISPLKNGKLKSRMPLSTRMHCLSHDIDDISPKTEPIMLGEDDGKILTNSSII